MEHKKNLFHDDFRGDNSLAATSSDVLQKLQNAVSDKNVLLIGAGDDLLDSLDNGKLYYAVPKTYEVIRWPKIRPFRTVAVDPEYLPFAHAVFDLVLVNRYLEFSRRNSRFLSEIFRILKRDGKLMAVTLNRSGVNKIRPVREIVFDISEAAFHVSNICGINKNSRFLSCDFDYNQNAYCKMLIGCLNLLSDVVIITADKADFVSESVRAFKEGYEMI
ncbi:MAG: class I SAM-dependent methyltransferase [Holosporaceae bacterium]|jgi:SAM-dependent methyltransferase|nr:class I SAM-dependent methyltransferase [Holosporaceae bacterium]